MAEIFSFSSDREPWVGEFTDREIGLAVLLIYENYIEKLAGAPSEEEKAEAEKLFPGFDYDEAEPSAEMKAAAEKARLYFPEMEEILLTAVSPESEETAGAEEKEVFLGIRTAFSKIFLDTLFGREDDIDDDFEELGRAYLKARNLYPEKKRKDAPSEEELAGIREILDAAEAEIAEGGIVSRAEADELMEEVGTDKEELAGAIAAMEDHSYDNTDDEELWEDLTDMLADYGFLPEDGEEFDLSEDDPGDLSYEAQEKRMRYMGQNLLEFFRTVDPDVIEYFLYREELETSKDLAREKAKAMARVSGLRGKKAERFIAKAVADAAEEVQSDYEDEYDSDLLSFFQSMDALERFAYRLMQESGEELPAELKPGTFDWDIAFFVFYQQTIGNQPQ